MSMCVCVWVCVCVCEGKECNANEIQKWSKWELGTGRLQHFFIQSNLNSKSKTWWEFSFFEWIDELTLPFRVPFQFAQLKSIVDGNTLLSQQSVHPIC